MESALLGPDKERIPADGVGVPLSGQDFSACYAKEMPGLIWFVMGLGADAHTAADVAQSAFAEAFGAWDSIQHPAAWLRRVAGRLFYRQMVTQETLVEQIPDQRGPVSGVHELEFREEVRTVLATLADLPPKQRQVMAWYIDGFTPGEIADHLGVDSASIRQNLAKARKHLKRQLGISEPEGVSSRAGSKWTAMV